MTDLNTDRIGWFEKNRIKVLVLTTLFIWLSLLLFLYIKADEVTKDPCSLCSAKQGKNVICTTGNTFIKERIYYPNGTIYNNEPKVNFPQENLSEFFVNKT